MKITPDILERQWYSIKYTSRWCLQINTQSQLESHIGYQSIGQRTLLLFSDREIDTFESLKSMIVSYRKRESDNLWTLSYELLQNGQHVVFPILCCYVIKNTLPTINKEEALQLVIKRYGNRANYWRYNSVL